MASTSGASSSVQGLASGIQWQDLIDQLIQVDTTNQITPITTRITAAQKKQDAWTSFGTAMSTLQATLKTLKDGTAFTGLTVNVPASASTGKGLLTAATSTGAVPGSYGVQVLSTASAQTLSGNVVSDPTAALGLNGQFAVAGRVVTVATTDSLNAVRDKINALNTGANASHISASVLYAGSSSARLILTSDLGGAAGLDLRDVRATSSQPSLLASLGFIDGTTANTGSDGAVYSRMFGSSAQAAGQLVAGATAYPAASVILVNGRAVTIDLQNQSLTDIAAAINAQSPNTASVTSTANGGTTTYALRISGTIAASGDAGSQPVLDLLGLTRGTTGVVKQQLETANVLQDSSGTTATTATTLLGLKIGGGVGAALGDTFTISGTKPDGVTRVSLTTTVDGAKTVGDMLADISTAFSAPGRSVTASVVGGKIRLTDDAGGDSGLSFSIAANNESGVADPSTGATLSFGSASVTTSGRSRELTAGADARIVVNGVTMTRSTNAISDAINGVTLNLMKAEQGTTIPVTISRDTTKGVQAVQAMVASYNTLRTLVTTSTAADGALAYDSAMRSAFSSLKTTLLSTVAGLGTGASYDHAALVGLTVDKTGVLSVDAAALTTALQQNTGDVAALFRTGGSATGAGLSYLASGAATTPGGYDVEITRAATVATVASTAANFVFDAGTTADTLAIADGSSGANGTISLATGDTPVAVAGKLNALFQAKGMRLSASADSGILKIASLDYGSTPSFQISYDSTDGTDVAGQLGIAAATVANGLDVQGRYMVGSTTYAATGRGQALAGDAGTPADGLMVLYTGASNTLSGHVDFSAGIGGLMNNVANSVVGTGGTISSQQTSLTDSVSQLSKRQSDVQARLDAKRAALIAQYTTMEAALSKIQAQGTYLTQQINSLQSLQSAKN